MTERSKLSRMLVVAATVWLTTSCSWFLPSVSEEDIQSIEGEGVEIVARQDDTNPTSDWIHTYLMLEVTGSGPAVETVVTVLEGNGWDVRQPVHKPDLLPVADRLPTVGLILVELDEFIDPPLFTDVEKKFADVSTRDDASYFVAILAPLDG